MGSFGGGNPIIWDIILQNLFILLVYQRVFTFTRLSPSYYYFLGRIVSPGQLILCINTGRCCVARFKPEKERERLVPFIIQFITGSPAPAQVIQNELFGFVFFLEEILLCSNFAKSRAAQRVCGRKLWVSRQRCSSSCQRESRNVPYLLLGNQILLQQLRSRDCAGKGSLLASQEADPKIMERSLLTFLLYIINLINKG